MYIQPIITSAFATYAMSRSLYTDQAFGAQGPSRSVMSQRTDGVSQGSGVGVTSGNEKVSGIDKSGKGESVFDPDAGKPKSASGDVLDLSQEARVNVEQALDEQDLNRREVKQTEEQVAQTRTDRQTETRRTEAASSDEIKLERSAQGTAVASASMESSSELTPAEEEQVRALQARDAEVRQHEQQHFSAGGAYVTGGPTYTYQTGPDGKRYAIGGEVSIDVSEVSGDPQATISKMQTVQAAALAPAEPSSQDQKVAAAARQTQAKARMELSQQQSEQLSASMESANGEEATVAMPDTAKTASEPAGQNSSNASTTLSDANASGASTSKADVKAEDKKSSSADASKASDSTKASASGSTSSAYVAQSKMVSGQTGGVRFSTFA